jgi:O-antigen/teichoic acid export membrane protein
MGLEVLATLVGLMFAWRVLAKHLARNVGAAPATYQVRDWLVTSLPMLMISGAQIILAKADIIMVGALMSPTEAGKYAVASLLAGLVTFLIGTANQVIAPTISQLFSQNRIENLQRMVSMSALVINALTLPLVIVLLVFGRDLLQLFGVEFADQYNVLTVLMIGQIVIVLWGSVGYLLTMTEYQVMASWIVGGSSILNIVLNFILIPQFGLIGAAVATSVTVSARSMVLGYFVWKKLNIMPTVFGPLLRRLS